MKKVTLQSALVGIDKHGAKFDAETINILISQSINNEVYFTGRGKKMSREIDQSSDLVDESISRLNTSLNKMFSLEESIAKSSKTASTSIRNSTEKLSQGLARIEKQADFNNLEKYVKLLERADASLTSLAKLEESGKLEKIALALK